MSGPKKKTDARNRAKVLRFNINVIVPSAGMKPIPSVSTQTPLSAPDLGCEISSRDFLLGPPCAALEQCNPDEPSGHGMGTTPDVDLSEDFTAPAHVDDGNRSLAGKFHHTENSAFTDTRSVPQSNSAVKCPHNCDHKGTFKRDYELNRHIRTQHGNTVYKCPFSGCYRKAIPTTFKRPDKLTAHIRTVHMRTHHESELRCPMDACAARPMTFDLLAVHMAQTHSTEYTPNEDPLFNAIQNAGPLKYRKCPIWHCRWSCHGARNATAPVALVRHLVTAHSPSELDRHCEDLLSENLVLVQTDQAIATSQRSVSSIVEHSAAAVGVIHLRCPICLSLLETHDAAVSHIDIEHFIKSEHKKHFLLWREHIQVSRSSYRSYFSPYKSWPNYYNTPGKCPVCHHIGNRDDDFDHHLTMLAEPESIKPFRRQLLKLDSAFSRHPVWNDLKA